MLAFGLESKEKPSSVDEDRAFLTLFFLRSPAMIRKFFGPRHERVKVGQIGIRRCTKQIFDVAKGFKPLSLAVSTILNAMELALAP